MRCLSFTISGENSTQSSGLKSGFKILDHSQCCIEPDYELCKKGSLLETLQIVHLYSECEYVVLCSQSGVKNALHSPGF